MEKRISIVLLCLALLVAGLGACQPAKTVLSTSTAEPQTLKIILLPIVDALPLYVADQEKLFSAERVKIEFIPASSAAERDQMMAAGQGDGMINDLVSVALYNKEKPQVKVVRFAQVASPQFPMYRILASEKSGFTDVSSLKGVEIGISQGSIIDYMTSRLLQANGFAADQIKTIAVPKMGDRMSLLSSGQINAATLPEPFGSLAIKNGAVLLLDDRNFPQYGNSVISFTVSTLEQKSAEVHGFMRAVEKAVALINADPGKWEQLLIDKKVIPAPLVGTYKVPTFPVYGLPTAQQFQEVVDWAKGRGLIPQDVTYENSVSPDFKPAGQ